MGNFYGKFDFKCETEKVFSVTLLYNNLTIYKIMAVKTKGLHIGHSTVGEFYFKIEQEVVNDKSIEVSFSYRHSFYAVYWIHQGSGSHVIDFEDYEIKPGRVFYIRPGQVHFLHADASVCYSALQFTEEFMLPLYKDLLSGLENIQVYKDLDGEEQFRLRSLFGRMQQESVGRLPDSVAILQSEINTLMLEIRRMGTQGAITVQQSVPDLLLRFKQLVEERFLDSRQVKDYASLLGITPNYLNVQTQKYWGESALSLINKRIVLEIKRRLLGSDADVSEIAYALDFNELSYFSRFFKRNVGLTPNAFRRQMNEMYQK